MSEVKSYAPGRPIEELWAEQMRDPAFVVVCRELEPEYQVAREVIALRLEKGLTQKQLAERMGTRQSAISRLENASVNPSLAFLQRVAHALDARLEIHLEPAEASEGG